MDQGIQNHTAEAAASLTLAEKEYAKYKSLKWVVFLFFLVIGAVCGFGGPKL